MFTQEVELTENLILQDADLEDDDRFSEACPYCYWSPRYHGVAYKDECPIPQEGCSPACYFCDAKILAKPWNFEHAGNCPVAEAWATQEEADWKAAEPDDQGWEAVLVRDTTPLERDDLRRRTGRTDLDRIAVFYDLWDGFRSSRPFSSADEAMDAN